jgi:hypothetical protein
MKVFTRTTVHFNFTKAIALACAFLMMNFFASAQLATWAGPWSGVTSSPRAATTKAANVNVADLARVNLTATSSSARFSSSNWTASNYLTITISANAGYLLNLNGQTISLTMGSSSTGPNLYTLRSSVDAYASSLGTYTPACSGQQAGSVTLPASGFNGLTSITFRVVGSTTGCSATFASTGTGGPSAITVNGAVTVAPIVPTVSTTAVTLITATDAVSGGDVTSDGGAAVSDRGVYYGTSVNPTGGTSETGTTGIFTSSLTPLAVNTQYFYRAYAINSAGTGFGTESSFYTLANVPGTPSVNGATNSSLDITLSVNGNPAITTFAIRETGSGNYVQADGSLSAAPVWRTNSQWGTVTVTGLAASTTYSFDVKARNGSNVETNFSTAGSGTTLAASTPTLTATTISDFGNVCLNVTAGANSFTVSGSNLNNSNITISSPNPAYTFSLDNLSYQSSVNQPQAGGSYDFPVYVKFTPTATGSNNSTINIGGGGASSISVNVNGAGINTIGTATTDAASLITSASATLNGSFTEVCSTITGYGFEYSLVNNFTNGTGIQVPSANQSSGVFSAGISGLGSGLTYYFKAYASNGITTVYGNQQSFTTDQLVLDAPIATTATTITSSSFLANWGAVTNATGYRLDVGTSPNFLGTVASFAAWTFPTNGTIVTPSTSNSNNAAQTLTSNGGTIGDVTGATTRAATANAWGSGSDTKYWQIDLNTTGLYELTISSKQRSSGTGPRDFKLQYKVGAGAFTDVPSGVITVADNFTNGVVSNLNLPSACDNQTSISIRWIMTSNTSVNGGSVGTGTSRIDDIDVQGKSAFFLAGYENRAVTGTSETVSPLTPGTTYYYRVRATNGAVASANSNVISATTCIDLPVSVSITANPGSTICAGTSVTFTATPGNGGTSPAYQWYNGVTPIGGETASTYTTTSLVNGDAISVQLTSSETCTTGNPAISNTINMTVNALVPVSVSIAANPGSTICAGTSVTFTATPDNGGTSPAYQWYNGVTPIGGETASTYTTTTLVNGDAISVQLTSSETCTTGNPATSNTINITVNPLPATAGLISGPTDACPLIGSVTPTVYSIDPVPGVSAYQWDIPVGTTLVSGQGTTSISVIFDNSFALTNSQFKVRTVSAEGCIGAPSSLIVLKNIPGIPVAINGPTNACPFVNQPTTATYTIAAVQYATSYTWTVQGTGISLVSGQGTTSIEVSYANNFNTGVIRVVANSNCGSRSARSLNISRLIPTAPVVINGQTNVCSFIGTTTQVTYSIDPVANATSYVWTVPSNVTLVSGQGTTSINVTINSGFSTSILKVKSVSNCFTSGDRQLTLTAASTSIPGAITGPNNACTFIGTANIATYSIRKVNSAISYIWTVPAGMTILSHPAGTGVNDTIITVAFDNSFVSGTMLQVQSVNCNVSSPRNITINRSVLSAPGLISGPTNVCELMVSSTNPSGTVATYRIPKLANALSYSWSITGNASITSHPNGAGVNDTIVEVVFNSGFTGGIVQVSASNGCGISSVRSLSVSRLNAGTPGGIDIVETAACPNRVYTYSLVSLPSNATSLVWTIPASGTLVSGAGTTSITVSYPSTAISGAVTVTALNNCSSSNTRSVTIKLPACVPNFTRSNTEQSEPQIFTDKMTMDIFPNPTTSQFNLQVISAGKEKVIVRILDIQGRLVRKFTVMPFETTTFGQDLKAGSYIIETTQGAEKLTRRVMKF